MKESPCQCLMTLHCKTNVRQIKRWKFFVILRIVKVIIFQCALMIIWKLLNLLYLWKWIIFCVHLNQWLFLICECYLLVCRDRIAPVWPAVRDHLYNVIVNSTSHSFLLERSVVGLLRISIRLLRREEITSQVLTSLRILLMMKPNVVHSISRQVSFYIHPFKTLMKSMYCENNPKSSCLSDQCSFFIINFSAHPFSKAHQIVRVM